MRRRSFGAEDCGKCGARRREGRCARAAGLVLAGISIARRCCPRGAPRFSTESALAGVPETYRAGEGNGHLCERRSKTTTRRGRRSTLVGGSARRFVGNYTGRPVVCRRAVQIPD